TIVERVLELVVRQVHPEHLPVGVREDALHERVANETVHAEDQHLHRHGLSPCAALVAAGGPRTSPAGATSFHQARAAICGPPSICTVISSSSRSPVATTTRAPSSASCPGTPPRRDGAATGRLSHTNSFRPRCVVKAPGNGCVTAR